MSIDGSRLQIAVEEQERWRRKLSVTVPAALVAEEEKKAASKLAARVSMKGFRKGHVPKSMVASRFGGALRQEALDRLINDAYRQALSAEDLRPISEGEMEDMSYEPGQDLTFAITFDVQPQIDLARVGGFAVERPTASVSDEHVDEVLKNIQTQNGAWKTAEEGKPEDGDLTSVRIRKLDEDNPDSEGKEYEFTLGEGQALPQVEESIKTLAIGGSGEFTVTFPDDFPDEERRGDSEQVEITVLGRKVKELPELDDDLARQVGEFETLDALKDRIRQDLEREAVDRAEGAVRGRLLDLLVESNPFEVPRSMVDRYAEGVLGEQKLPEDRKAEIMESIRPEAERAVKRLLVLDRIAQTQSLDATEADLDERIEAIAVQNGSTPEKIYASFQKAGRLEALEREITERKVFDFLKSESEIIDAPAA